MKLKFDNQILMQRLGDYKKAEKGAKDLCQEYEGMKLKYFNVLTENERQKRAKFLIISCSRIKRTKNS